MKMNSEWSDQAARRSGFSQQAAPPDDIWSENDALLPGVLDADVPFMQQFEGSSFPIRPPPQNSGPQGYRGRSAPQPNQPGYGPVNGRSGSSLTSASDPTRNLHSPYSWGVADNQASKQPTSRALGGAQDDLRRDFDDLRRQVDTHNRKLNFLHSELTKNHDEVKERWDAVEEKWNSIDEKVMRYNNPEDLFRALEERFKRTMDKNNQTIKNWVQLAVEGPVEHDTNGGTGGYKNSTWGEQMEGGDGANQDGASFDFLK
ncbi:hypothetical protein BKA61DRAFT_244019 [Leptodontidium sp. MPI-SDFR-AT-0119]|nr:hypothetical protein BKA61DRAFT_244019 [Leptodontidium sp. MPI-SDFR-AT-0119]